MLAVVGAVTAWAANARAGRAFWARYLTGNAAITTAIFSAIPYKTPWNLLPFYAGRDRPRRDRVLDARPRDPSRPAARLAAVLSIAAGHLGWQAWRASVTYASDPRNPYVYAQTVPTPSAWPRASASWPPCTPTASACR